MNLEHHIPKPPSKRIRALEVILVLNLLGGLTSARDLAKPVYQLGPLLFTGKFASVLVLATVLHSFLLCYGIIKRISWIKDLSIGVYTFGLILAPINIYSIIKNPNLYQNYILTHLTPDQSILPILFFNYALIGFYTLSILVTPFFIYYLNKHKNYFTH